MSLTESGMRKLRLSLNQHALWPCPSLVTSGLEEKKPAND